MGLYDVFEGKKDVRPSTITDMSRRDLHKDYGVMKGDRYEHNMAFLKDNGKRLKDKYPQETSLNITDEGFGNIGRMYNANHPDDYTYNRYIPESKNFKDGVNAASKELGGLMAVNSTNYKDFDKFHAKILEKLNSAIDKIPENQKNDQNGKYATLTTQLNAIKDRADLKKLAVEKYNHNVTGGGGVGATFDVNDNGLPDKLARNMTRFAFNGTPIGTTYKNNLWKDISKDEMQNGYITMPSQFDEFVPSKKLPEKFRDYIGGKLAHTICMDTNYKTSNQDLVTNSIKPYKQAALESIASDTVDHMTSPHNASLIKVRNDGLPFPQGMEEQSKTRTPYTPIENAKAYTTPNSIGINSDSVVNATHFTENDIFQNERNNPARVHLVHPINYVDESGNSEGILTNAHHDNRGLYQKENENTMSDRKLVSLDADKAFRYRTAYGEYIPSKKI